MKQARELMGMPITVEVIDPRVLEKDINEVFDCFDYVDKKFSTYKQDSEICRINRDEIKPADFSADMREVLQKSEETKKLTNGYFNIQTPSGQLDPSGLVKGWAIFNASKILIKKGFTDFYVEAGGDVEAQGKNAKGQSWSVGIKNPFNKLQIVKVVNISNQGLATSGTYERGDHIYNPHQPAKKLNEIVSITVIGPNIYEADRFATAAFAMGREGISFIENQQGLEGYMIDSKGVATMTSGFEKYTSLKN